MKQARFFRGGGYGRVYGFQVFSQTLIRQIGLGEQTGPNMIERLVVCPTPND